MSNRTTKGKKGNTPDTGKYGKYFIKDVIHETPNKEWGGEILAIYQGYEDIIPANSRALPAITVVRKPYMFHEPVHKHIFAEYFFFFGSNPMDMHDFNADVEFSFGPELEKHTINSPTIVIAAPGVYHCPLNYARVGKPFYCLELFMTAAYTGTNLGEDPKEIIIPEPNYNKYIIKDVIKNNAWGGEEIALSAVPEHVVPTGARINMGLTVVRKPYMFRGPTHKHNFAEFFYFFGSNPMDMKEFDAEIEFSFGEEKERHIVNSPAIVIAPPGVFHCPINYTKVNKPFYCLVVSMTSKYTSTDL